jgi:hypothetical protein
MFGSENDRKLRRLFEPPVKVDLTPPKALEENLMRRFDALYPGKESVRMTLKSLSVRKFLAASAAVLILGAAACVAPVDMEVDMGRRVTIEYKQTEASPGVEQVAQAVRTTAENAKDVQVRAMKKGQDIVVAMDIWGDNLPQGSLGDKIKAKIPSLENAKFQEEILTGQVRGTLGAKLGHDLLNLDVLDTDDVETARLKLMQQLAASGVQGKIDVQVEGDGNERKVRVRVEQEECADAGTQTNSNAPAPASP